MSEENQAPSLPPLPEELERDIIAFCENSDKPYPVSTSHHLFVDLIRFLLTQDWQIKRKPRLRCRKCGEYHTRFEEINKCYSEVSRADAEEK